MASQQQPDTEFSRVFFADIVGLHPQSERQYDCAGISDIHHCQLGVLIGGDSFYKTLLALPLSPGRGRGALERQGFEEGGWVRFWRG